MLQCPCMGGAQLCLCQQVTLWLLVCFGYALPLLLQYIEQAVTLRAFLRRCGPGCDGTGTACSCGAEQGAVACCHSARACLTAPLLWWM